MEGIERYRRNPGPVDGKVDQVSSGPSFRHGLSAGQPLTPRRERELVLAAGAGDQAACEELVAAFLPAIASIARRYRAVVGVQRAELLQAGVVGLLRAIKRAECSEPRRRVAGDGLGFPSGPGP